VVSAAVTVGVSLGATVVAHATTYGAPVSIGSGFSDPFGVAVDSSGDLFVVNSIFHGSVAELKPGADGFSDATQTTVASNFINPAGVAVDSSGDLFVAASGNNSVAELKPGPNGLSDATETTMAFDDPDGLAVDSSGDLFVAATGSNNVVEVTPGTDGLADATQTTIGSYNDVEGVAVDSSGDLFLTETGDGNLVELMPGQDGFSDATKYIIEGFDEPGSVAVDSSGHVFVTEYGNGIVAELTSGPDGLANATPTTIAGFEFPAGVAVDSSGDVFISVDEDNEVVELTPLQSQTISFPATAVTYGQADFSPATASSKLAVTYSDPSGQCAVDPDSQQLVQITGAGSCTITASQSGGSGYAAAKSVTQTFTIKPAVLSVNASDASTTYGQPPTLGYSLTGYVNGDNASTAGVSNTASCSVASGTSTNAGTYAGAISCTPGMLTDSSENYTFATGSAGTLTINKAPLTVNAPPSASAEYGNVPSSFTPTYQGFVYDDSVASLTTPATCTTTATDTSSPGVYPSSITCAGAVDPNYTISYGPAGTLTITKAGTQLAAAPAKAGLLSLTFSATLTRADNSADGIAGKTIAFALNGKTVCQGTTNSSGVASCKVVSIALGGAPASYTASFAGDADYLASSATGKP
jgi:hypothetical protein